MPTIYVIQLVKIKDSIKTWPNFQQTPPYMSIKDVKMRQRWQNLVYFRVTCTMF